MAKKTALEQIAELERQKAKLKEDGIAELTAEWSAEETKIKEIRAKQKQLDEQIVELGGKPLTPSTSGKKGPKPGSKSKATESLAYDTLLAHVKASEGGASRRGITGRFIEPAEGLEAWVDANMKGKIKKEGKGPAARFVVA